ncbi:hypothetical protein NEDG_00899 [Nematocida displodere]|uniref:Uncharacterized protein n=1 Tax=Nematocida displodere TaxID=1805483 RepID=A0A177EDG4_9MICR|nr:hypothetical protein NEDG_00899 [Nematocida displodere]
MSGKVFLRRKVFLYVSLFTIIMNAGLGVGELFRPGRWIPCILCLAYSQVVAVLTYLFTLHRIGIDTMLYAIFVSVGNSVVLVGIGALRFLFGFKASAPYAEIISNIPAFVVAAVSLVVAVFFIAVRMYIVLGLVSPIVIQREKGIESAIVLVRREYSEVFH